MCKILKVLICKTPPQRATAVSCTAVTVRDRLVNGTHNEATNICGGFLLSHRGPQSLLWVLNIVVKLSLVSQTSL